MALVPREVLLVNEKIVIGVQLPEPTVKNVEMLVTEVGSYLINVLFRADNLKHVEQVGVLEVTIRNFSVVIRVERVKYPHDYCVCVALLKLWRLLEEFKAGMRV